MHVSIDDIQHPSLALLCLADIERTLEQIRAVAYASRVALAPREDAHDPVAAHLFDVIEHLAEDWSSVYPLRTYLERLATEAPPAGEMPPQ